MQILAPSIRALVAVVGLHIIGAVSADANDPPAAAGAIVAPRAPEVIANCDGSISECANQFEKIVTVYEHNTTTAHINWVTSNVTLPTTTITSTAVTIETRINKTETDALCEKTFVVTLPGTSTVTVHLNATHVNKIIPTTTKVTTSTITQYETQVSVCLVQGTHQLPMRQHNPRLPGVATPGESPAPRAPVVVEDDEIFFETDAGIEEILIPDLDEEDRREHDDL